MRYEEAAGVCVAVEIVVVVVVVVTASEGGECVGAFGEGEEGV